MDALALVLIAAACLLAAYLTYGRWLSRRVFDLRDDALTPATELEDGADYVPTKKSIVFGHHFTSIAGTGPIVGPAIAVMWGWLPAILWVVLGSIFVGAVHDLGSLVVSLRNKGRSIGDIAGDLLGPRARFIFLLILIMGLWIVLAIFGLVVAAVLRQYPGAIFPVLIQVPIALVIGLLIHRKGKSIVLPSIVALAVMYLSVIFGDAGPLHAFNEQMAALPTWAWVAGLLVYAYVASVLPVWTLLQPRDYINALQLITALGVLVIGLIVAAFLGGAPESDAPRAELSIVAPMIDWQPIGAPPMLPVLFITIACGACSGFHCLVGSGTTSKQMKRETDAKAVGYGSMLTEGFLATLVIAACVAGLGIGMKSDVQLRFMEEWSGSEGGGEAFFLPYRYEGIAYRLEVDRYSARGREVETAVAVYKGEHFVGGEYLFRSERVDLKEQVGARIQQAVPGGTIAIVSDENNSAGFGVQLSGAPAFASTYASWQEAGSLGAKVGAFVQGSANLIASTGITHPIGLALMGVLVASFAGTTMDTACRLQRYVVQELSRTFLPRAEASDAVEPSRASLFNPFRYLVTTHGATLFAIVTAFALALAPSPGQPFSLADAGSGGLILWPLFGATNQLLGGFAFIVITAWLIVNRRPVWFIVLPLVFMLAVPASAMTWQAFIGNEHNPSWVSQSSWLLVTIACATLLLEAWLITETLAHWAIKRPFDELRA